MGDLVLYSFMGLVIMYILYAKGIILADFNFLSPKEAMDIMQNEEKNVTILDVRTDIEFNTAGYIKGAILIPVQSLEARIDELKKYKERKILVYCASGNRSITASRILYKHDFNTYNINGGINNWKRSGYDIR